MKKYTLKTREFHCKKISGFSVYFYIDVYIFIYCCPIKIAVRKKI